MLSCILKEGQGAVHATGTISDIMTDVTMMIHSVYDSLSDESAKRLFAGFVKDLLPSLALRDFKEKTEKDDDTLEAVCKGLSDANDKLKEVLRKIQEDTE